MSLYVCDVCNCVDERELTCAPYGDDKCSECRSGKWHGHFEKEQYNPDEDNVDNRANGITLG